MLFLDWKQRFEFWNLEYDSWYNELYNLKRAGKIYIAMKCLLSHHPLPINTSLILANHAKTGMKMFWLCKMLNALLRLHNNHQLPDLISCSSLYLLPHHSLSALSKQQTNVSNINIMISQASNHWNGFIPSVPWNTELSLRKSQLSAPQWRGWLCYITLHKDRVMHNHSAGDQTVRQTLKAPYMMNDHTDRNWEASLTTHIIVTLNQNEPCYYSSTCITHQTFIYN